MCGKSSNKITPSKNKDGRWQPAASGRTCIQLPHRGTVTLTSNRTCDVTQLTTQTYTASKPLALKHLNLLGIV